MDNLSTLFSELFDLWGLVTLFVLAVFVSSLGAIAGVITRNMMVLICLCLVAVAVVVFHQHLPLPREVHHQLQSLKNRF